MNIVNQLLMNKFFATKSILPNYRFIVTFIDIPNLYKGLKPIILENQTVISVNLPDYDFKKESQKYGPLPRSFPVLDYDGLELTMVLEENAFGSIGTMIHKLKERILDYSGLYNPPALNKINRVVVTVMNDREIPVAVYTYRQCAFLKADQTEYNHSGNESVKYTLTLNADYYSVNYPISFLHV
jgi:hypothetical protein